MRATICLFSVIFASWRCDTTLAADPLANWTLRNPLPTPNNLRAVTSGSGLLVAVGTVGTIVTSTDAGDTWVAQDSGLTNLSVNLVSTAYGNGRFVAMSALNLDQVIVTSLDGTNWSIGSSGFANAWSFTSIAFGSNTFVLVGADTGTNVVLTSTNGLVWTRRSAGISNALSGVTYAQNQFVAVGGISSPTNRGVIITSPDGVTWTTRRSNVPAVLTAIAGNATGFVAVGGRTTSRSPTGVTWTDATDAAGPARNAVAAGTNLFVSTDATYGVGDSSAIYTSPDGASWTSRGTASSISGLTFSNGRFIAVGTVNDPGFSALGTRPAIYLSADGISWSSRYGGFRNVGGLKPPNISAAAFGNGIFVALMTNTIGYATAFISTNGADWSGSIYGNVVPLSPLGLTFAAGQFVTVGGPANLIGTAIASSTNGTNWTQRYTGSDGQLTAITYGGGQYVAVGRRGSGDRPVMTSPDAIVWTVQPGGITNDLFGVAFGGGAFVAVGTAGTVARSTDGASWSTQSISATNQLRGVTFAGGQFVAVGDWGSVFTSPDGTSWTRRTSGSTRDLNTVAFFNNRFVAGGDVGTVLTSTNGVNWSATDSGTDLAIRGAATGLNTLLLTGNASLLDTSTNGLSWIVRDLSPPGDLLLRHVSGVDDRILAFAFTGHARSTTGRSWATAPGSAFTAGNSALYTNGLLVAVGTEEIDQQTRISVSANRGDSWMDISLGNLGQLYGLVYAKGLFVATGDRPGGTNGVILTSTNGINWTYRNSGFNGALWDVAFGNNLFVAVGTSGGVQSTDGINWTSNPDAKGETVTFGGGKFVAAGAGASVSTNGTVWASTLTNTVSIENVRHALGTFVAVGPSGIYTSTNGIHWTNRFVRTMQKLNAVDFANDSFFVVGFGGTIYQSDYLTNTPAAILQGPQNTTVIAGANATLTASYTGRLPLRFQWYKNGAAIRGATEPSLPLVAVSSADAGSYHVVVTNDTGSQTSSPATLTVVNINVGVHPENLYLFTNTTGGFSAIVTGGTPTGYQWFNNSTPIAGATNATLVFANAQVTNGLGFYFVRVNFAYGQLLGTNSGQLIVLSSLDEVYLSADPSYQDAPNGSTVTIAAFVAGPTPLSFQWRKNNVVIPGATNATLVLTNVQLTNSADYTYTVTYALGIVTNTSPSTLVVYHAEPPVITGGHLTAPGNFRLAFTGLTNRSYQVDYATNLVPPVYWNYYSSDVLTTNPAVFDVPIPIFDIEPQGYFRVRILPP